MKEILENEVVRALSWKQPYANLMLPPNNKIETRTWNTKYRGLVLICASKVPYHQEVFYGISGKDQYARIWKTLDPDDLPLGEAIAVGRLVDSRPMKKEDEDKCFVEYHPDLFCHVYEDVTPISPIPWKGSQGWRTLTEDQIKQIKFI